EIQGNKPRPTINDELLALSVGDISFSIPANYTVFPRDRRAGERENVSLYASWPRMNGYVPARREDFVENKPDARRIDMLIFEKQNPFTEQDRLNILYTPHIIDELGSPFDYNLTLYEFRQGSDNASGYAEKMMFTGVANDGTMAVLFCYPETEDNIVPADCYREYDLSPEVSVKYYFKKFYLPEWRRIDEQVHNFIDSLRVN
ncbi:MAG: hypothetical protein AAF723_10365, partial [Pseudomonadota bacterium]